MSAFFFLLPAPGDGGGWHVTVVFLFLFCFPRDELLPGLAVAKMLETHSSFGRTRPDSGCGESERKRQKERESARGRVSDGTHFPLMSVTATSRNSLYKWPLQNCAQGGGVVYRSILKSLLRPGRAFGSNPVATDDRFMSRGK